MRDAVNLGGLNLNVFSVGVMKHIPPRHHGIAVGVATTGSTFGMFALVPAFSWVAARYGWRLGYVVMAGSVAALLVPTVALVYHRLETASCRRSCGRAAVAAVVPACQVAEREADPGEAPAVDARGARGEAGPGALRRRRRRPPRRPRRGSARSCARSSRRATIGSSPLRSSCAA
jgi:hypothetical protein